MEPGKGSVLCFVTRLSICTLSGWQVAAHPWLAHDIIFVLSPVYGLTSDCFPYGGIQVQQTDFQMAAIGSDLQSFDYSSK